MPSRASSHMSGICLSIALVSGPACADAHQKKGKSSETDAGPSLDSGAREDASLPASGPWGSCGPSPLAEPLPPQVIEVAEEALRPGGWAAQDIPGYGNATKCKEATLGAPYRSGTVDTRMLNGSQTPDDFVVFYDQYVVAWFCDGRAAGRLDVGLSEGRWQVTGHGQNTDWNASVAKLEIDFAPDCTPAYLVKYDLGSWVILTDKTQGVIVHRLFASSTDAHTKEELVKQLRKLTGS